MPVHLKPKGPKRFRVSPKYFGLDQNILELCQKEKFRQNYFGPIYRRTGHSLYNAIMTPSYRWFNFALLRKKNLIVENFLLRLGPVSIDF